MCKQITVRPSKQSKEALEMSWWTPPVWGKVKTILEECVGRWSLLCNGKARQESTDLDLFMTHEGVINEKFLDLLSKICFNGVNHSSGLKFNAEPVKQPMRILQKLVRRYRRDFGCLTDLVRCTVISDSLENVKDFLQLLYLFPVVGLEEKDKDSRQRLGEQIDTGDQIFRITTLENRFDPSYNQVHD